MNLIKLVENDIHAFMKNNQEFFFNERDFQMHLAMWLKDSANKYDDVDLEYYVPLKTLNGYIWDSELRLDLVVRKGDEYLPIELKYKTQKVDGKLSRFGEYIKDVDIVKFQHALNHTLYNFWKDVRRLELVHKRFDHVVGGLVVFLTNNTTLFSRPTKETSRTYHFSMEEGTHDRNREWQGKAPITKPNFQLDDEYNIHWQEKKAYSVDMDKDKVIDMRYCIVTIK